MTAFHESIKRSVFKSITFRIVVVVSDLIVIFALTHRYDLTLGVTIGTNLASMILYYMHERIWNLIRFGRKYKKKNATKDLYV